MSAMDIKEAVREKYSEAARGVSTRQSSCCGPAADCCSPIT